MTTTPNMLLEHIIPAQFQKEVTANEAFDALDRAVAGMAVINFATDANLTLTDTQAQNHGIRLTDTGPVLTASRNVIIPERSKFYSVFNATAQDLVVTTAVALSATVTVTPGEIAQVYCDGTDVIQSGMSVYPSLYYVTSDTFYTILVLTQAEYDVIVTPDANTLYFITA